MLFRIILWIISIRVRWLSRRNKAFRYAIKDKQIVLQFTSLDGKAKRFFEFNNGAFSSKSKYHKKHSLAKTKGILGERIAILAFESAASAVKILIEGMKDEEALLRAIQQQKLIIEGDFTLFMWFGWLADQL